MAHILVRTSNLSSLIPKSNYLLRSSTRLFSEQNGSEDDKTIIPEEKDKKIKDEKDEQKLEKKPTLDHLNLAEPTKVSVGKAAITRFFSVHGSVDKSIVPEEKIKETQKSHKKPTMDLLLKLTDPAKAAVEKAVREENARKAKEKLSAILADFEVQASIASQEPPVSHTKPKENAIKELKQKKEMEKLLGHEMKEAVDKVASTLPEPEQSRSELLSRLMGLAKEVKVAKSKTSINEILSGIKIEQQKQRPLSPSERILQSREQQSPFPRTYQVRLGKRVNLFRGRPLGIFTSKGSAIKSPVVLDTWNLLARHEKEMLGVAPPSNAFEEMIRWTEKGILWKYPLDNEQDLEEKNVSFDEHIFLEPLLDEGFPKVGPIREFMELVAIGLSKNPYITVQRKHEHIQWFRDFFADKGDLLEEAQEV